jgi:hypothetical protein
MTISIGFADGGLSFEPAPACAIHHTFGFYWSYLAPVLWSRRITVLEAGAQVGLLSQAPNRNGLSYVELAADGYVRQPLHLVEKADAQWTNINDIDFGPITDFSEGISHVAVFQSGGRLSHYGEVILARAEHGTRTVRFAAYSLLLELAPPPSPPRQ